MKLKYCLVPGIVLILMGGLLYQGKGSGVPINIDGEFADWEGIAPVFIEEEVHPKYWIDIQQGFVAANDTTLFIRLDYAAPLDYWDSLLGNITIRTPSGDIYILMYQIVYETHPFWSFSAIFPGRNLSSFLNDRENPAYVDYQNSVAIDVSTNRTVEYYFLLADLGLQLTDAIDIAFWHYENETAGQYSTLLHRMAGIAYQVTLNPSVTTTDTQASTTSTTFPISTTTDVISLDVLSVTFALVVVLILHKRRSNSVFRK